MEDNGLRFGRLDALELITLENLLISGWLKGKDNPDSFAGANHNRIGAMLEEVRFAMEAKKVGKRVGVPPCPCECNNNPSEFCGGCGHAGCGRR